jgi:hypothetical protein
MILVAGFQRLKLPLDRLPDGVREIFLVIGQRMFPPDLGYVASNLVKPFIETFAMAFAGTVLGIVVSVPLAWFAAANMTPSPRILYPLVRMLLVVARSIHESSGRCSSWPAWASGRCRDDRAGDRLHRLWREAPRREHRGGRHEGG